VINPRPLTAPYVPFCIQRSIKIKAEIHNEYIDFTALDNSSMSYRGLFVRLSYRRFSNISFWSSPIRMLWIRDKLLLSSLNQHYFKTIYGIYGERECSTLAKR
jgi:hypothetical protein